jgi:hypothetical protein
VELGDPSKSLSSKKGSGNDSSSQNVSLSFGNIEFSQDDQETSKKRKKGPTDLKGQLEKALTKKKKLDELAQKDSDKAHKVKESMKWSKVEALASGEKVKDDVQKLKKSLKRQETIKKKSAKEWSQRKHTVQKQQQDKQKKRQENLQARKDDNLARKMGKKKKSPAPGAKGKKKTKRPGFEGGAKRAK